MSEGRPRARVIAIHQGKAGPPARNDRLIPVLEKILQGGMLDQKILVPFRFTPTHDDAEQVRKDLYAAARYFCSCGKRRNCTRQYNNIVGCPDGGMRLSCRADIVKDDQGRYRVQVQVFDKKEAMRAVVARYGPDPSKWPYQARAKKLPKEDE